MDHKAWPWKKKSMEKIVVESNGEVSVIFDDHIYVFLLGWKMDLLCSFIYLLEICFYC